MKKITKYLVETANYYGTCSIIFERNEKYNTENRQQLTSSTDIANYLRDNWKYKTIEHVESFYLLGVNKNMQVQCHTIISTGGISSVIVDVRLIFQYLLLTNCTSFFVAHNHPSNNLAPSSADDSITTKLQQAGKLLDIQLLDHLIITSDSYFSYYDNGKL